MKRKLSTLCLILALGGLVRAQDAKPDPTGKWKQTNPPSQTTFTFKLQGEALTGTVLKHNGPLAITNGMVKGDQVSFQTRHEASRPKGMIVTETCSGTFSGDTITGKIVIETNGNYFASTPWQVKRDTAEPKDGAAK
ncbi:MAG: hypothetical protein ABSC89_11460 [Verrucomicrobiota bacterium]|jgi:hypothetical protein